MLGKQCLLLFLMKHKRRAVHLVMGPSRLFFLTPSMEDPEDRMFSLLLVPFSTMHAFCPPLYFILGEAHQTP